MCQQPSALSVIIEGPARQWVGAGELFQECPLGSENLVQTAQNEELGQQLQRPVGHRGPREQNHNVIHRGQAPTVRSNQAPIGGH
jgi:hypothetical protein